MTNQISVSTDSSPPQSRPPSPQPTQTVTDLAAVDAPGLKVAAKAESPLLEQLIRITLRLRLRGLDMESSTGLSGRELDLIALLTDSGPTSVKILVADLGLPRSTMTAIVDRLEDRGLVKRLPNLEDRRSIILEATPMAFDALVQYREAMMTFVQHLKGVLKTEEEEQLIRLIEKIAGSF